MTKIVHLSTFSGGGAGIAAKRLHRFLSADTAFDSHFVTLAGFGKRPYTLFKSQKLYRYCKPLLAKLFRYEFVQDNRYEIFSTPFSKTDVWQNSVLQDANIIHIHWTSEFLDWSSFFQNIGDRKIVMTLHDMFPLTGGCHHADECTQYVDGCHHCPQLKKSKKETLVKELFEIKEEALSHLKDDQLIVVGVSKWITELSQSSRLLGRFRHVTLPNPIDERVFFNSPPTPLSLEKIEGEKRGVSRAESKDIRPSKTILFSAPDINNPRKGFSILIDALKLLKDENIRVIALGKKPKNIVIDNVEFVGHVSSAEELNRYYNDADLFVTASKIESFGLTVAESLLAGTPVVGFNVGGVGEMIVDGENGFLAELTPSVPLSLQNRGGGIDDFLSLPSHRGEGLGERSLANAITKALHHNFDRELISKDAQERFGATNVVKEYIRLYEELTP